MEQVLDLVGRHGGAVVFAVVFLDQLGLPIPTVPLLLAFGALAGQGRIDPRTGLFLAVSASLCADFVWFRLGRWKGGAVLGLLCRIALEPDACVSRTHDLFARHGVKSLLLAKFIPGFDTIAPPLAGMLGIPPVQFLLWSGGGALLWLMAFGGLGYLFSERLTELAVAAEQLGSTLVLLLVGLVGAYLAWKYMNRHRLLRSLRMERITPDELHELMSSGRAPIIVDAQRDGAQSPAVHHPRRAALEPGSDRRGPPEPIARERGHRLLFMTQRGVERPCGAQDQAPRSAEGPASRRRNRDLARSASSGRPAVAVRPQTTGADCKDASSSARRRAGIETDVESRTVQAG